MGKALFFVAEKIENPHPDIFLEYFKKISDIPSMFSG